MHDLTYKGGVGLGRIIGPIRRPGDILTVQSAVRPVVRPTCLPDTGARLRHDGSEDNRSDGPGEPAPETVR